MRNTDSTEQHSEGVLRVAWFSYFPVEWVPDLPAELQGMPRMHPATWQRVLWNQYKNDPRLKLEIIIPRSTFPRTIHFDLEGTRFHCIRTPPGLRAASLYWLDTFVIARELRKIRPDVVHAWGTEFGGAAIAARLKYPALVTMQGILTWYATAFQLNRHARLSCFLEPGSLRRARIATCESSFGMRYLGERYPRLELRQVEHAPDPIFSTLERAPQTAPPRVVCLGSLTSAKGPDIVFKALDGLVGKAEFELLWIGGRNQEMESNLRGVTSPALWSRVTFKHDLAAQQVAGELSRVTILLHAARADNSPNSVKEAVVAGVPVVASNTGGIPDYVHPEKNGFLFAPADVEDCREKVRAALAHPLFSAGRVEGTTLRSVREYLSAETMAKKFRAAYAATLRAYRG